ncbi:MAG TPA: ribonuclease HII [Gemmatimonadales bacterium]|nr:ribonuclease HII [Gemmatimonadales bacterium]
MPLLRPDLSREATAWAEQRLLIGVDEVGRGPLAGPVVAAAIVFPARHRAVRGVRDSKTLNARRREILAPALCGRAVAWAAGAASVGEIDRLNIRVATALAMRRALNRLLGALESTPVAILVDGLPVPELGHPHQALVDGDALCYSVAAAGIVAKTIRDRLMCRLALRHPGFAWQTNMGYGTAAHIEALGRCGPTPHHRRSFAPVSQLQLLG